MTNHEDSLIAGMYKLLDHRLKAHLRPRELALVKKSVVTELRRALAQTQDLTLRFYDKQAPSHKILKVTPAPEHEKDRNR